MKKLILTAVISTFALTGCNTVQGLGQDMTRAGTMISNAAQNTRNKISSTNNSSNTYTPYTQQNQYGQ